MIAMTRGHQRVLAVGAHTDDVELGCGATLSRLAREGATIQVVAFSRAEASLPAGVPEDTLERECRASFAHLGLGEAQVQVGRIPVRHFPAHRQEVLEALVALKRSFDPSLVLTACGQDTHQDHQVVHAETVRAFRGRSVLGYEAPWNQQHAVTNLHIGVTEEDVQTKVKMMSEYATQAALGRSYAGEEYLRSAARFRGVQGGHEFAEAFEVVTMSWGLT